MTGTVNWFNPEKGFGFITPDEGEKDVFFHRTQLQDKVELVQEGQKVSFVIGAGIKGPEAKEIKLITE